jgi:hypothetical protein
VGLHFRQKDSDAALHVFLWTLGRRALLVPQVVCSTLTPMVAPLQVAGRDKQYITLPKHYCSCEAFYHEVVLRGEAPFVSGWPPDGAAPVSHRQLPVAGALDMQTTARR